MNEFISDSSLFLVDIDILYLTNGKDKHRVNKLSIFYHLSLAKLLIQFINGASLRFTFPVSLQIVEK
ncbi:hypothetical protein GCM10011518_43420 [Flavobacterium limi]|uniref:Uncharacterized protein n=1 Tax=Flavobacterium limi TaxID=2045105 RepID=A0ABQ1UYN0_9FLAO|nr:hypothetical protein GCM10011518_43420 [Flavobacterium limi]